MEILCICLVCSIGWNVSCPSVSSFSTRGPLPRSFCSSVTGQQQSKENYAGLGRRKGFFSELRPSWRSLKAGFMTGSFFLRRAGFRWEQLWLGHGAQRKDWCARLWAKIMFGNSASHSTHQEVESDKGHLLCCYKAHMCLLLQHRSPAGPTSLWNTPVMRYLDIHTGWFSWDFVKVLLTSGMILPNISVFILK